MWVWIKGIFGKQAGKTRHGNSFIRAPNVKRVSRSKGTREILVKHYRKLEMPTTNTTFDAEFEEEVDAWGRGERRCIIKGRQWFRRVAERFHRGRSKRSV